MAAVQGPLCPKSCLINSVIDNFDDEMIPPLPKILGSVVAPPILGFCVYAPPAADCVEVAASWAEAGAAWAASATVVASAIVIPIAARVERKGLLRGEFSLFMTVLLRLCFDPGVILIQRTREFCHQPDTAAQVT
jgi:hypothetical protein